MRKRGRRRRARIAGSGGAVCLRRQWCQRVGLAAQLAHGGGAQLVELERDAQDRLLLLVHLLWL
jgi:hypothetical protein